MLNGGRQATDLSLSPFFNNPIDGLCFCHWALDGFG
jgi:hypothetical protein